MTDPDIKRHTTEVFEDWADHYDTERETLPYFRAQAAFAVSKLTNRQGRILDIGCAAGGEIPAFRSLGFSVVGMDLSPRMLQLGRRRFADDPQVQFCRADVDHLPFADGSMNHIVCLGVFEFLPDYDPPLKEISRVMQPGGVAVFAIPSRISLYNVCDRLVDRTARPVWRSMKRLLGRPIPDGLVFERNLCVPWRYRALLRKHGFEPEDSRYTNFFIYPLDRFPELNTRVAARLEFLCRVPVLRWASSVYMVAARKK